MIIVDRYTDFLNGKEVEAIVAGNGAHPAKGMHVMAFHDSIAINSNVSVPREKQSQYIGVEGVVTALSERPGKSERPFVKVMKV